LIRLDILTQYQSTADKDRIPASIFHTAELSCRHCYKIKNHNKNRNYINSLNSPYMCQHHLRQARLEEDVFDLGAINKAIPVSVGSREHLVILCFLCWSHNPLASRHLAIHQPCKFQAISEACLSLLVLQDSRSC